MISDRDLKFRSEFWKCLLQRAHIKGFMTAAHHPSADGQAERSNQTVEIALRTMLVGRYEENWISLLPEVELALNTAVNASSRVSPYEVIYGFPPKLTFHPMETNSEAKDLEGNAGAAAFVERRELVRQDIMNTLDLA